MHMALFIMVLNQEVFYFVFLIPPASTWLRFVSHASLFRNGMLMKIQGPRPYDDLESIVYTLLDLLMGGLP